GRVIRRMDGAPRILVRGHHSVSPRRIPVRHTREIWGVRGGRSLFTKTASAGPPGHRLKGHLPDLMRGRTGFFTRCARDYGDFVPLRFGPRRAVLVSDADAIADVFLDRNKNYMKP